MRRRPLALALALLVAHASAPVAAVASEPEDSAEAEDSAKAAHAATREGAAPASSTRAESARVELARVHFQRGVNLYRAGAYDAAFAEFMRAYDLAPNHRILYNLAQVQAQRHDYVEALSFFQRYLAAGERLSPERAEEVRAEIAELSRRVSRLLVEINVDDAQLFVNGQSAGELPRDEPLLLNAGVHRLRVEKDGYVGASRVVTLAGGEQLDVSLELIAELDMDEHATPSPPVRPLPAPLPLAVPAPAPRVDRTALWTSLVATGALTGATVTFGLLTRRANATLDEQLSRFPAPRASIEAGRTRVRTFALLTDGFGAAAAAALGLSTYLFFSTDALAEETPAKNGLSAQIGPRGSSVTWAGAF